jgi:hypothetical protein
MHIRVFANGGIEYPYTEVRLQAENPDVSFPAKMTPELLADYGVHPVTAAGRPDYDSVTHSLREDQPSNQSGLWVQTWIVEPRSEEEVNDIRAAKRRGMVLSFAQLLIGLVAEDWITETEGEAWLAGTLPAPVLGLIATLPPDQRFPARARATVPSEVLRTDPLVSALGAAQGKTAEELDQFFLTYAEV